MAKITPLLGSWAILLALGDPATLAPDQTFQMTERAVELLYSSDPPPAGIGLPLGLARWDDQAKLWFPAAASEIDPLSPALLNGRGSVKFNPPEGLRAGIYTVLLLEGEGSGSLDALQIWVNPYTPAIVGIPGSGGTGGGGTGAAMLDTFTTADGRNVAPTPDSIVKNWPGSQMSYGGAFAKLPRPTTAQVAASSTYDGGDVVLVGTRLGKSVTETITPNPGNFVEGKVVFDGYTAMNRTKAGTKGTTSLGIGSALGLAALPKGGALVYVDDAIAPAADYTLDSAQGAVVMAPAKIPDGKLNFRVLY